MPSKILVSAGETSGDLYASELVRALQGLRPGMEFFGCAGPRMRQTGVRPVIESESLSVVGLVEVVGHLPGIYKQFKKLVSAAEMERPDLAVLTDSPDFNLRLLPKLDRIGVPVIYFIAPQVWAWRQRRVRKMQGLSRLLCIFPFEEPFFRQRGVTVEYIGHPLTRTMHVTLSKDEFFRKHGLDPVRPLVTILPGSRVAEVARHLPLVADAARRLEEGNRVSMMLATPEGFRNRAGPQFFKERIHAASIKIVEGETWDAIAHADVALAASGTVTIETALLGTPMVTFYRVAPLSWFLGKFLVDVPFYTMVNLVAGRKIVPEFIQGQATGEYLASAVAALLADPHGRERMRQDLAKVARKLATRDDPMDRAARIVLETLDKDIAHES